MKTILGFLIVASVLVISTAKGNSVKHPQIHSATLTSKGLIVMPNAATKDVKISFNAALVGDAVIIVLDESGKKVLQQTTKMTVGKNSINIDNFHSLTEGNYTIQLINNNKTHSTKFLIWN